MFSSVTKFSSAVTMFIMLILSIVAFECMLYSNQLLQVCELFILLKAGKKLFSLFKHMRRHCCFSTYAERFVRVMPKINFSYKVCTEVGFIFLGFTCIRKHVVNLQ